ncbi:MAG: OsmC family protein [Acidobacteria bacterium]|nr:OsmC family protein [Acidobacteriota bacterium]
MREVAITQQISMGVAVDARIGGHVLRLDEPHGHGGLGTDSGPTPTETLLAAVAACEAMTLRLYVARKGWDLRDIRVRMTASTVDGAFVIVRKLELDGDLDTAQRARLLEIAGRCPVQRAITGQVRVVDAPE